jgi:hypothetical protein
MEMRAKTLLGCEGATATDRRNQRWIRYWALLWVGTWLGVGEAISRGWLARGPQAIAASLVPVALGVGVIAAYRRFLREADELRRKIELDALALAFGVGVVGSFAYWLLELAGAVAQTDLMVVACGMVLTHAVAVLVGNRRYS